MSTKGLLLVLAGGLLLGGLALAVLDAPRECPPGWNESPAREAEEEARSHPIAVDSNVPLRRRTEIPPPSGEDREEARARRHRLPPGARIAGGSREGLEALESIPLQRPKRRPRRGLDRVLGLVEGGPTARWLERWLADKGPAERAFLPGGAKAGGSVADRAAGFNRLVEGRTRRLREEVGDALALRVAERVPLFRMDPRTGEIHRVDLFGRRLPEREEPED